MVRSRSVSSDATYSISLKSPVAREGEQEKGKALSEKHLLGRYMF